MRCSLMKIQLQCFFWSVGLSRKDQLQLRNQEIVYRKDPFSSYRSSEKMIHQENLLHIPNHLSQLSHFFPSLDSLLEMDPSGKALGVGRILKIFPFPPQNFKTVERSHSKFQCISHLKPHFPQNVNDKVINNLSFLPHTFDKICFSNANDDDRPTFQVVGTFYLLDPSSASSSQGITHTHNLEEQMLPHHNPKPTNNTQSQGKKFLHD